MKGAFTRSFNKAGHLSHYSSTGVTTKRSRSQDEAQDNADWNGDEENGDGEPESDKGSGVGIVKDPAIKVIKKGKGSSGRGSGEQKKGRTKKQKK